MTQDFWEWASAPGFVDDMHGHKLTLYAIARWLPAKLTVEIGTNEGNSTRALLAGIADAEGPPGLLHSVDVAPCLAARRRIEQGPHARHWRFHQADSSAWWTHCPFPLDLVLIDGDHTLAGVARDFRLYGPRVRQGGLVLFHDQISSFPGVGQLVESIRSDQRERWDVSVLPYYYGLTILRRR